VDVHEGVSWTFLTLAIPLALDGRWVTLAWAAEGVALLWLATRTAAPVAAWGGTAALLLAAVRAAALDHGWLPGLGAIPDGTVLVDLLVVVALAIGGGLAGRALAGSPGGPSPRTARAGLWVAAVGTLAAVLWREPSGLWPATLLTAELLVVGGLARVSTSPAFVLAAPIVAFILLLRVLGADDELARQAAGSLVSRPLLSRIAACGAIGLVGGPVARSPAWRHAVHVGRMLSGLAGLTLLFVLSVNWTRHQQTLQAAAGGPGRGELVSEIRWRTQVGLSLLWTVYAAAALAWGFVRSNVALRYAALALLGLTVIKVFAVDMAAVKTAYRILSFLVLGVVQLLVSVAYQRRRASTDGTF
jgi:uncharacterized membrane protein